MILPAPGAASNESEDRSMIVWRGLHGKANIVDVIILIKSKKFVYPRRLGGQCI